MAYAVIWTEENIMITIKDISNYTGIPVGTIANDKQHPRRDN